MTTQTAPGTLSASQLEKICAARQNFPSLKRIIGGKPAVFFDGPGGTQVSQQVIDAVSSYYMNSNANAGGLFKTSEETDSLVEQGRIAMSDLLNCSKDEIIFGANATTLTFAISRAIGRSIKPGDEIIVTTLDHDCNVAPWKALEERGAVVRFIDVNTSDCTLNMQQLFSTINEKTKLVAIGYASNAVGTINDIEATVRAAHTVGALVYVDAVHYAPHGPVDVQKLNCDFLVCSPYKFFAPHLGVLYGKQSHLERFSPYKVRPAHPHPPISWETGTQSFESIAGVVAAIDYIADLSIDQSGSRRTRVGASMTAIRSYESNLSKQMVEGLVQVPGLELYGIKDTKKLDWRTPTFGFNLKHVHPDLVARHLSENGIFSWNGNFYALGLTERLDLEDKGGMVRLGCVHYNTMDEVTRVLDVLMQFAKKQH